MLGLLHPAATGKRERESGNDTCWLDSCVQYTYIDERTLYVSSLTLQLIIILKILNQHFVFKFKAKHFDWWYLIVVMPNKTREWVKFQDGIAKQGSLLCFSYPLYSFHFLITYLSPSLLFTHHYFLDFNCFTHTCALFTLSPTLSSYLLFLKGPCPRK